MTDAKASRVRALVVDDEPLARERLRMLAGAEDWLEIAEECADGTSAVAAIQKLRPDLVFLDVEMPGASGFDVIEAIGADRMPFVVFVTAYDKYAIKSVRRPRGGLPAEAFRPRSVSPGAGTRAAAARATFHR